MSVRPWFPTAKPVPNSRLRLFCLPYAGGGASAYREWSAQLPELEIWAVQPPGRESRWREPGHTRIEPLVADLLKAIQSELDRPYALFGHSMGALIAFELARALGAAGLRLPEHVVVSGRHPPHISTRDLLHTLPDAQFTAALRRLGGISSELLEQAELLEFMLPIIRRDIELDETAQHRPGPPLPCPLTAFGGEQDTESCAHDLEGWLQHSSDFRGVRMFPGDHFFIHSQQAEVLRAVKAALGTSS